MVGLFRQGGAGVPIPRIGVSGPKILQAGDGAHAGPRQAVAAWWTPGAEGGGAAGYPVVPHVAVSEEVVSSHLKCLYKCVSAFVRGDPYLSNGCGARVGHRERGPWGWTMVTAARKSKAVGCPDAGSSVRPVLFSGHSTSKFATPNATPKQKWG